jgi:hypothetical protein
VSPSPGKKPTHLGPVDRGSPCLRISSGPETGAVSTGWAQLGTEAESSLRNVVLGKSRTMAMIQKDNN